MASRAIRMAQGTPVQRSNVAITIGLTATAALGIAAGVIPKRETTLRSVAIGGSVLALAITGIIFAAQK